MTLNSWSSCLHLLWMLDLQVGCLSPFELEWVLVMTELWTLLFLSHMSLPEGSRILAPFDKNEVNFKSFVKGTVWGGAGFPTPVINIAHLLEVFPMQNSWQPWSAIWICLQARICVPTRLETYLHLCTEGAREEQEATYSQSRKHGINGGLLGGH